MELKICRFIMETRQTGHSCIFLTVLRACKSSEHLTVGTVLTSTVRYVNKSQKLHSSVHSKTCLTEKNCT